MRVLRQKAYGLSNQYGFIEWLNNSLMGPVSSRLGQSLSILKIIFNQLVTNKPLLRVYY